jgi:hypothetical protein
MHEPEARTPTRGGKIFGQYELIPDHDLFVHVVVLSVWLARQHAPEVITRLKQSAEGIRLLSASTRWAMA